MAIWKSDAAPSRPGLVLTLMAAALLLRFWALSQGVPFSVQVDEPDYLAQLRLRPFEHYVDGGVEYLVASSQCYGPYFDKDGPQRHPVEYSDYMRIFNQTREVARFTPSVDHPGPELRILKLTKVTQ